MIPTFVIFLREGIEASMIVAILLSYLDRIGQRRHFKDVLLGVAAAMAVVTVGGVAAFLLIDQYSGSNVQTYFETATYLIAAAALMVVLALALALGRGRVAGPGLGADRQAQLGNRRFQIALNIDRQRLQR